MRGQHFKSHLLSFLLAEITQTGSQLYIRNCRHLEVLQSRSGATKSGAKMVWSVNRANRPHVD